MNPRLLSAEEKLLNRKAKNRRKRLRKVAKKRARLMETIKSHPRLLGLIEAGVLDGNAALTLLFGRLDKASSIVRELHLSLALLDNDAPAPLVETAGKHQLAIPERTLQQRMRGAPTSLAQASEIFLAGIRAADALRSVIGLPSKVGELAFLTDTTLAAMLPGICVPKRLRRRAFLVSLKVHEGTRNAVFFVFSTAGFPLFRHPLPAGDWVAIYERENFSGTDSTERGPDS